MASDGTTGIEYISNTVEMAFGTYYVKETTAPKGYELDSTVHSVTITPEETTITITAEDKPGTGYVKLKKVSAIPSVTDGNRCYSLKGAEYGVYSDEGCTKLEKTLTTIDEEGNSDSVELGLGTYYVKETKASTGYELDTSVYTITIKNGETTVVNAENGGTVEDYPGNDPAYIQITKICNGDETTEIPTLEGTQFTICYYDGYFDTVEEAEAAVKAKTASRRTWVTETKKSPSGKYMALLTSEFVVSNLSDPLYYDGNKVVLPYGTITIQETKPAADYTLNGYLADDKGNTVSTDSEVYVAQVTKDSGAVKLSGGNEYTGYNTPISGSIKIKKYDTDGKSALEGVTFELKNSKGEVVAEKTTDSNGEILFDDLYPDVYTITETKTVDGHTLLKEPFTAEIPMRVTEQEIKDNDIDRDQVIYDPADDIYYINSLTYEIGNSATFTNPEAGGNGLVGSWMFLTAGFAVILAGIGAEVLWKKRRI